jgi:hypothetical protein
MALDIDDMRTRQQTTLTVVNEIKSDTTQLISTPSLRRPPTANGRNGNAPHAATALCPCEKPVKMHRRSHPESGVYCPNHNPGFADQRQWGR